MRVRYENDPSRGPGYGLLHVEDAGITNPEVRFAVIRSGDHKTLHPASWEDTEHRLAPDGVTVRDSSLRLAIGPGIVCQLDELNTYRFVLFPPAGAPLKARLELSGIIYPPEAGRGRVSAPLAAETPPPPLPPVPEPASEPKPEPLPPVQSKKSLPVWLLALLLLILAGGGFMAWRMLSDAPTAAPVAEAQTQPADEKTGKEEPEPTLPKETGPETTEPEATEPETPAPAGPVQAQPEAIPPPLAPMEQARQFLRGNGSAADGLALSRTLPQTPEGRDAAYLLLEAAAEQGQPESMLELAAFYDPLDTNPKGSILPDAEQAWEWYGKAEQAGKIEAAGRKQALRAWLEDEVGKGSAAAKDILARIK